MHLSRKDFEVRKRLWPVLALLLCVIPALAQASVVRRGEPGEDQSTYTEWQDMFPGDQNSLAYGSILPLAAMDHALTMPGVIEGINNMLGHGYTREPNADYASSRQGYAVVVLGFRKPGVDIAAQEPILIVATKAFEVPNVGWRPATQIYGGVIAESSGVWVPRADGDDKPLFICGTPVQTTNQGALIANKFGVPLPPPGMSSSPNSTEQLPDYSNVSCWSEIVAIGVNNMMCNAFAWYDSQSPGTQALWQGTFRAGTLGALGGAYSAGRSSEGNPLAMAGGAAFGAAMSMKAYWSNKPDSTRRAP